MNILNQQRFNCLLRVRPLARHLRLKIPSDSSFTLNHPITQPAVIPINRLTISENITIPSESLRGEKPQRVFIYSYQNQHPRKTKGIQSELTPSFSSQFRTKSLIVRSETGFLYEFDQLFPPVYGVRDSPVQHLQDFQNLDVEISRGFMGQYFQVTGDTS